MITQILAKVLPVLVMIALGRVCATKGILSDDQHAGLKNIIGDILLPVVLFQAFFTGFSIGVAPVFSYNYGSGNRQRLARLFGISVRSVLAGSAGVFLIMELFAPWMVAVFAPPPSPVYDIAVGGIRIYSTAYLFYGTNVFTSALFTALSNGKLSALVFLLLGVFVFSSLFGATGIWMAGPFAEAATVVWSLLFLKCRGAQYGYLHP